MKNKYWIGLTESDNIFPDGRTFTTFAEAEKVFEEILPINNNILIFKTKLPITKAKQRQLEQAKRMTARKKLLGDITHFSLNGSRTICGKNVFWNTKLAQKPNCLTCLRLDLTL
jgi:hypothetical protein